MGLNLAAQTLHCLHNARLSGTINCTPEKNIYMAKVTSKQWRKLEPILSLLLLRSESIIMFINFQFLLKYVSWYAPKCNMEHNFGEVMTICNSINQVNLEVNYKINLLWSVSPSQWRFTEWSRNTRSHQKKHVPQMLSNDTKNHQDCVITVHSIDNVSSAWWRHEMETFFALLAICAGNSPVPMIFPTQRPVTQRFDVLFDLRPNNRLSKQSWGWWFETSSRPIWRHCNGVHISWDVFYNSGQHRRKL